MKTGAVAVAIAPDVTYNGYNLFKVLCVIWRSNK